MSEGLGLATAFRTLTRLSVPGKESRASRSLYWFPLAGLFYGACFWLCSLLPFSSFVRAALELAFLAWMSRGFHYDGLSDTADGFGGGWTKERRLEIMKDSRVGSFGVLAVGVVLLVQFSLLASLQDAPFVLLSTPVWARSSQVLVAATHGYARKEGTAGDLVRGAGARHLLVVLACCVLLLCFFRSLPALAGFLGALSMGLYAGHVSQKKIGGVTGDVLGTVETLSGTASLLCSLAFLSVQA